MKNMYWLLGLFVGLLFMTGCGKEENANNKVQLGSFSTKSPNAEVTKDDFIYRLVSEKKEYNKEEVVKLYAELEYIGEQEEITIYHAMSPFYFPIEEKIRGFIIHYPMAEPLITRTLVKGEPFREEYKGSGAYSPEDGKDYVKFMESFIENGFPTGYYVVNGSADFFVGDADEEKENYHMEAQVDFKVY